MTVRHDEGLAPIVKTVTVPATPERAFHLFTTEMTRWWPLKQFSIGADGARRVTFSGQVGGQIVEYGEQGSLGVWGTVTLWEPPGQVSFTWHPGSDPDDATQVTVRFTPSAHGGTDVELTHDRWDARPGSADAWRGYHSGWDHVLAPYVRHADLG